MCLLNNSKKNVLVYNTKKIFMFSTCTLWFKQKKTFLALLCEQYTNRIIEEYYKRVVGMNTHFIGANYEI